MARQRRSRNKRPLISLITFAVVAALAFIGIQYLTKTGLFKVPGVVKYADGLDQSIITGLSNIFTDKVTLDKDVTISTRETQAFPDLKPNEYIYNISVPVTDFYDSRTDASQFEELTIIPLNELDFTKKLLSIDGKYYLDTLSEGAYYQIITFDSPRFEKEIKPLVDEKYSKEWPTKDIVLTFAQTGVTALSRGMNAKLNAVDDATYFSQYIADFLKNHDYTHTSNESSFSDMATSDNICSDPRFIDTLLDIGLDIVELTGNHNVDCGNTDAINTIDIYEKNNIKVVGGGKNATEASKPLQLKDKGTNITMFAYNQSTGGATHGDTPGANQFYADSSASEIAEAKARGDIVIVDIQYYECSAYASEYEDSTCDYADSSAGDQIGLFRSLIDAGADIVVGTSAHQPQTYELYENGVIFYGLGNLFFDQAWWPGTTRSLILTHYFMDGKLLQTKITPSEYDANFQTQIMDNPSWYLDRLVEAKPF